MPIEDMNGKINLRIITENQRKSSENYTERETTFLQNLSSITISNITNAELYRIIYHPSIVGLPVVQDTF